MERRSASSALAIFLAVVGLLVAYPLSAGPVAFVFGSFDWGPLHNPLAYGLLAFYSPLDNLPGPIGDWVNTWWNLGIESGLG
jgi:hypothetical protein